MLEIKHVTKVYKTKGGVDTKALDDVSISFGETGLVFLLGKSGSGKSTLLNVCGGLDEPTSGEVIVKGKSSKDFSGSDVGADKPVPAAAVQTLNPREVHLYQGASAPLTRLEHDKTERTAGTAVGLDDVEHTALRSVEPQRDTLAGKLIVDGDARGSPILEVVALTQTGIRNLIGKAGECRVGYHAVGKPHRLLLPRHAPQGAPLDGATAHG